MSDALGVLGPQAALDWGGARRVLLGCVRWGYLLALLPVPSQPHPQAWLAAVFASRQRCVKAWQQLPHPTVFTEQTPLIPLPAL